MNELLGLVDALAAELGRPIGLDDRRFRSLAYSSHVGEVDRVRRDSILQRAAPPEVTAWLESRGLRDADGVVHVPANRELGMSARVCVPVRFDGTLLGYLWLIDAPTALSDAELETATRAARDIGVELFRLRRLEQGERERERELLAQLVGRRDGDPAAAAAALLDDGLLAPTAAYGVLLLTAHAARGRAAPPDGAAPGTADASAASAVPDPVRVRLASAAEQLRRGLAPHHLLVRVGGEWIVCVLACQHAAELEKRAQALAAAAAASLADAPGWEPLVGAGDPRPVAAELALAYRQARTALRVGRAVGGFGAVVAWGALGAYRTLAALLPEGAAPPPCEALERLLACGEAATLVPTLECYLDLGGDARAAAEQLYLHRSSLYGRLHRIEEVAGVDLRSGEDRLQLHMALRLRRLARQLP